jgi:hypothetical protein
MYPELSISIDNGTKNLTKFQDFLKGKGLTNPNITKTDLRIDVPLQNGNGNYEFQLNENVSSDKSWEQKLGKDHLFLITHIGLLITKRTAGEETNAPLATHPDANIFATANEAKCLESVFQGKLKFQTSATQRNREILTNHFRYVPPQGHQLAAATSQGVEQAQYGPSIGERGYYELGANILLDGNDTNKAMLALGQGLWTVLNAGVPINNLVLMLHGYYYYGENPSNNSLGGCVTL